MDRNALVTIINRYIQAYTNCLFLVAVGFFHVFFPFIYSYQLRFMDQTIISVSTAFNPFLLYTLCCNLANHTYEKAINVRAKDHIGCGVPYHAEFESVTRDTKVSFLFIYISRPV